MHHHQTVIHVTHEAAGKMGGIGAVIEGVLTCPTYLDHVERNILIGPLLSHSGDVTSRLGDDGEVFYSSVDGLVDQPYKRAFAEVERKFGVAIVYGRRRIVNEATGVETNPEVLLVDAAEAEPSPINAFKAWLYEDFDVESNRYEDDEQYDQYVRIAPAAIALLRALSISTPQKPALVVAHEHMGVPTAMAALMDPLGAFKTLFYAHEVATVRTLVEHHPGHDTMFLNTLRWAIEHGYYLDEVFGPQDQNFKHALVTAAAHCDSIVGVSDLVCNELQFLGPKFHYPHVELVYNGLHAEAISLDEKHDSKGLLQQYAENLGLRADYVFSHVARMAVSKAFWRDLAVLHHLDARLAANNEHAVLYVLSTDAPQRTPEQIETLQRLCNWPTGHCPGLADLTPAEAEFFAMVQNYNRFHQNTQVVFINQFGFTPALCGERMPAGMTLGHLRRGVDAEFCQSIYEPFGISGLEPLTYGALCVTSSACGCNQFVRAVIEGAAWPENILVADYSKLSENPNDVRALMAINQQQRDRVEVQLTESIAGRLYAQLPRNDVEVQRLLESGYELTGRMSWDCVVRDYLLPAFEQAYRHPRRQTA